MRNVTRRAFVKGTAAIPFAIWLERYALAQPTPRVRYNVMSSAGQNMLRIYRNAVQVLANKSAADPRSWIFQAYTHWVKPDFNPQTKQNEINRIYNTTPPAPAAWKTLAQTMWNSCQAHGPGEDENFFLPWHRMYVYFFERIVGAASGHPDFTLPYWNYSDTGNPSGPRLPTSFINPNNSTNPLWRQSRNAGSNAGSPINQGQPNNPLSLDALKQCVYKPNGAIQGFCMALDFGLHGNVHVLIGNGQGMGNVPFAAQDPIFWMHHCNIDRLWASWNSGPNARANPTDAGWLGQEFTFADENGNEVLANVQDFEAISKLSYTYDAFEPLPPCQTLAIRPNLHLSEIPHRLIGPGPVELGATPVRVRLKAGTPEAARPQLLQQMKTLKSGEHLHLVLRGLHASVHPGVLYYIYLNLPEGKSGKGAEAYLLGSINFFEFSHGEHLASSPEGPTAKFISFDISEHLENLRANGALEPTETTVTLVPSGKPPADAKPLIGEIALIAQ